MVYKSGQIFLPFCHNPHVWRTDRRTDRILIARPRLHSMQRGKNHRSLGGAVIAALGKRIYSLHRSDVIVQCYKWDVI